MGLKQYKLEELIELVENTNSQGLYGPEDVRGINNQKEMMMSKADLNGRDLMKFQIVKQGEFVFNHRTSRNGSKFSITYNIDADPHIFTEDYVVFRIKEKFSNIILKEWLYMYFCRPEFDRYVITNSWGSSTEFFNWSDLCDVAISLPSIDQQRRFVNVYLSLQANLEAYQSKTDDLKLVCDGFMDQLKKTVKKEKIGEYIELYDVRNTEGEYTLKDLKGISIDKEFIESKADMNGVSLYPYIIVKPTYFTFVPVTSRNGGKITLAYNDTQETYIVSSAYNVFRIINDSKLLPDYLFMFFNRPEFDRYARFNSWGSAREVFTMDDMNDVRIPIPSIEIQRDIVNIHKCFIERKRIAAKLKQMLYDLCPILIRGSLQTTN